MEEVNYSIFDFGYTQNQDREKFEQRKEEIITDLAIDTDGKLQSILDNFSGVYSILDKATMDYERSTREKRTAEEQYRDEREILSAVFNTYPTKLVGLSFKRHSEIVRVRKYIEPIKMTEDVATAFNSSITDSSYRNRNVYRDRGNVEYVLITNENSMTIVTDNTATFIDKYIMNNNTNYPFITNDEYNKVYGKFIDKTN